MLERITQIESAMERSQSETLALRENPAKARIEADIDHLTGLPIRRAMAVKQLMNRETGRPFGKVTFSGGVAEVTEQDDPRSALSPADAALYQAKLEGRNRILAV